MLVGAEAAAALLEYAGGVVAARVRGRDEPPAPSLGDLPRCGVFVTLTRHGALRGCIGHIVGDRPAVALVREMAVAAARDDPRFPPVGPDELDDIEVEVSLLTPLEAAGPDDVIPGEHGVVLRLGGRMGVFLPQVASDQGWDRATLLEQLSRKAGLPRDAWRDTGARLEVFRTQVVGGNLPR